MNPFLNLLSLLLGIVSIALTLIGNLLFDFHTTPTQVYLFDCLGFICGLIAMALCLKRRDQQTLNISYNKVKSIYLLGFTFALLGILSNVVAGIAVANKRFLTKKLVEKVRLNEQNLATAIESYYIDHCRYPWPDFDKNGKPVIPHILTTPTAYLACGSSQTSYHLFISDCNLVIDPFKEKGKGILGYGCGYSPESWIVTSYGPDKVNGNMSIPGGKSLDPLIAYTDIINPNWPDTTKMHGLGYSLQGSGLTYDPTNGLFSPGDIWRRGP